MRSAVIIAAGVVVLLCLVCGVGAVLFGRSALQGFQAITRTGSQFLAHMQAGDFKAATQLIAPAARATYTQTELRRRWGILQSAIGKVQGWSVQNFKISADSAGSVGTLNMRVQGDKGEGTAEFVLKPEGEQWLITELRFGW